MNFRTAARHTAADLSSDMSMDPTMQDSDLTGPRVTSQPDVSTDEQDPATPGGPAPYNGVAPFGQPVTSDPEWLDPQKHDTEDVRGRPMPHIEGPDEDVTTLHNARRASYAGKDKRGLE
jgi:hypothetical protein